MLKIINCLDNNKFVIGVLRKMNDEFIDYIKRREDTLVIDIENIDYESREDICNNIISIINEEERNL